MSGVDNLRGIDYQVSYSVLRLLQILINEYNEVESIQFESLSDEEEDLNIYKKNGAKEYIQIKKKAEGYSWTPSELKNILIKFFKKNSSDISFIFISDGTGNKDIAELKSCLLNGKTPTNELLSKFSSSDFTVDDIKTIIKKTTLLTQSYTSVDSSLPGSVIKEYCLNLLKSTNFILSNSYENIYDSIWLYVFELSQECKAIKLDKIKEELERKGLTVTKRSWLNIPDVTYFKGRNSEICDIEKALNDIRKIVIKGISGIGKTSIMAKVANNLYKSSKNIFWFEINKMYNISDILNEMIKFLNANGFEQEAHMLNCAEIVQRIPRLIDIIKNEEIYILIDGLDKGIIEVKNFFEEFYKKLLSCEIKGAVVLSIIDGLDSYTAIDLKRGRVFEYNLPGLCYEDTLEILQNINENYEAYDISVFYERVGGYPVSINFLKELLSEESITKDELQDFQELSVETSNKYLFEKIYSTLSNEEQEITMSAAIFSYPFRDEEIRQVLNIQINPKYLLEGLIKKNIILRKGECYDIHDSIRTLLKDILSKERKTELHKIMVKFYRRLMEEEYEKNNEILYDDIFKWGYHVEYLQCSDLISSNCSELLDLNESELDALWAIERFGYPFAYDDPNLNFASEIIRKLINKKLIIMNKDKSLKYMSTMKRFALNKFDFFDSCFLHHLCITREISNHLGYIERFEPNDAFMKQGIICHWEHCIEYMPYESGEESCPIFGHNCPGEKEQADICKEIIM